MDKFNTRFLSSADSAFIYPIRVFIFSILFLPTILHAQLDSLKQQVLVAKEDTTRVNLYSEIFNSYIRNDPRNSRPYADSMISISQRIDYFYGLVRGKNSLANYWYAVGDMDSAMYLHKENYAACLAKNDTTCLKTAILNMANIEFVNNNFDASDSLMAEGARLVRLIKDTAALILVYSNQGVLRYRFGNYRESIESFFEADRLADIYKKDIEFNKHKISSGLALTYSTIGDEKNAIKHNKIALSYLDKKNIRGHNILYTALAGDYLALRILDTARIYLDLIHEDDLSPVQAHFYYKRRGQLAMGEESDSAYYYFNLALENAVHRKDSVDIASCHDFLGRLYYQDKNYRNAYLNHKKAVELIARHEIKKSSVYINTLGRMLQSKIAVGICPSQSETEEYFQLRDSLFTAEKISALSEIESRYQYEKRELENTNLRQANELQTARLTSKNFQLGATATGAGAMLLLAGLLYQRSRERAKTNTLLEQKNRHIQTLNREIIHRTKNQLDMAANLIHVHQGGGDGQALLEESESRIRTLAAVNRRLTPENDFARTNLRDTLQEVLEGNIFSLSSRAPGRREVAYALDMPDITLDADMATTIGLIINELSVNSLKYAFGDADAPHIRVEVKREAGGIELDYSDNGRGGVFHDDQRNGGLSLVRDLIAQIKGESHISETGGVHWKIFMPI